MRNTHQRVNLTKWISKSITCPTMRRYSSLVLVISIYPTIIIALYAEIYDWLCREGTAGPDCQLVAGTHAGTRANTTCVCTRTNTGTGKTGKPSRNIWHSMTSTQLQLCGLHLVYKKQSQGICRGVGWSFGWIWCDVKSDSAPPRQVVIV